MPRLLQKAFYQKIPLVIITADRPPEWIDQDDGQTIRQINLYSNYCKAFYNLPVETNHPDDFMYAQRLIFEAFNTASEAGNEGPVHINVPFREPLYGDVEKINIDYKIIDVPKIERKLSKEGERRILETWSGSNKKMIVCGLHKPDKELNNLLDKLAKDASVAIITETTSNMQYDNFICNIDAVIDSFYDKNMELVKPEILITFGSSITSKKLKADLRKYKPKYHWHISSTATHTDTFQALTDVLRVDEKYFFNLLSIQNGRLKGSYGKDVKSLSIKANQMLLSYTSSIPFSDLKVLQTVLGNLPGNSDVHLGNSSPIRYANLVRTDAKKSINYFCNRGVSGIDGITSTASGAAYSSGRVTTLITGDLAFFYDSNALWNKYLSGNLKIIVINNSGGGIFRLIDSKETPLLEKYFEAKHSMKAEGIVKAQNIPYYLAKNETELEQNLNKLYKDHKGKPAVLEVFTPNEVNAGVFAGYFKSLKK